MQSPQPAGARQLLPLVPTAIGALALALAATVQADVPTHVHKEGARTCYFDTIKYTNKGSYVVQGLDLYHVTNKNQVGWYLADTESLLKKDVTEGSNFTVDLNKLAGKPDQPAPLNDGQEVWPVITITFGHNAGETCHKDGHKLVYAKDSNRTIHFMSAGSTQNNNRCEYAENISNQCHESRPDASSD